MHNCGDGLTPSPYVCAQNKEYIPIDTWVAENLTSSPDPSLCGACFPTRKPSTLQWWCCSRFGCLFSCVQMRRQIVCVTSYLPSAHIVMQDIDAMPEKSNSLPQRACNNRSHRIHTKPHSSFTQYHAWHFWIVFCDIGPSRHLKRNKNIKKMKNVPQTCRHHPRID